MDRDVDTLLSELQRVKDQVTQTRRELQDVQQLLRAFLDHNPALSFIKDEYGRYLFASKSFAEFFHVAPEAFLGKTDFEWLPEATAQQFVKNDDEIRASGIPVEFIETVPRESGAIHSIVHKFPIRTSEGRTLIGGIAIDITRRLAAEDEIEALNRQLAAQVKEMARMNTELQQARDHALEASRLKTAFLANMSHELRTPLSGILGMNELLLSSPLSEQQTELSNTIQQSALALLGLVNDLLDISKIEAGKLRLEKKWFNLPVLVEEAVRILSHESNLKGLPIVVSVEPQVPTMVNGDSLRLQQVLLNLISNAIKFSSQGKIDVSVTVSKRNQKLHTVKLAVSDTGIGIGADELNHLFKPFTQIDASTTRRYGGSGLGLTISKSLVEMMEGEIGVQSSKGEGSTFWFTVSLESVDEEDSPANSIGSLNDRPSFVGKKILVVEDNPALRNLMIKQLAQFGLQADSVENAENAIASIQSRPYDLVLMDCHLPDVSGFDATRAIRALTENNAAKVPIIAITASALQGDTERCFGAGMDDCLAKPVNLEELGGKLRFWLSKERTA